MRLVAVPLLALILALSGCDADQPTVAPEPEAAPQPVERPEAGSPATPGPIDVLWQLPEGHHEALLDPSKATETAPPMYKVKFETTKGDIVVQVHRDWAPLGADRFYNLVKIGFYDRVSFFRTIDKFMTQFGISGYPAVSSRWREAKIPDDPVKQSNTRGRITFATSGPNSRTSQVFINYVDGNTKLDGMGFAPFGEVIEGMDVVDALYKTGEGPPTGNGPHQGALQSRGGAYLEAKFPDIDQIKRATVIP